MIQATSQLPYTIHISRKIQIQRNRDKVREHYLQVRVAGAAIESVEVWCDTIGNPLMLPSNETTVGGTKCAIGRGGPLSDGWEEDDDRNRGHGDGEVKLAVRSAIEIKEGTTTAIDGAVGSGWQAAPTAGNGNHWRA